MNWNLTGTRNPCVSGGYLNSFSPNFGAGTLWCPSPTPFTGVTCTDPVRTNGRPPRPQPVVVPPGRRMQQLDEGYSSTPSRACRQPVRLARGARRTRPPPPSLFRAAPAGPTTSPGSRASTCPTSASVARCLTSCASSGAQRSSTCRRTASPAPSPPAGGRTSPGPRCQHPPGALTAAPRSTWARCVFRVSARVDRVWVSHNANGAAHSRSADFFCVDASHAQYSPVTAVFFMQNRLTGPIPQNLGFIGPGNGATNLAIWDNALRGALASAADELCSCSTRLPCSLSLCLSLCH